MGWNEAAHPRAAAGSSGGGQFISYDAKSKTGTGYNKKEGDSRVKRLQKALNALGYTDLKNRGLDVDGMLGPLTTSSVKKAQAKLGLKTDGKVTPELLNRLEDLADARKKSGKASKTADAWIRKTAASKTAAKTAKKTGTKKTAAKPAAKKTSAAKTTAKPATSTAVQLKG